jgi:hypothetical protein
MIAALDLVVDFLAVNGHLRRSFDPDLDHLTIDTHHRQLDASVDNNAFAGFARENKHGIALSSGGHVANGQRMFDVVFGGIGEDDLLADQSMSIESDRALQINGRGA